MLKLLDIIVHETHILSFIRPSVRRSVGRSDGRTDGRMDGWMDGHKYNNTNCRSRKVFNI